MKDKNIFNEEIGHFEIQERFLQSIRFNRLSHAYLFYGNEGVGKEAFAIELAKLLNCEKGPLYICQKCSSCVKINHLQHPDLKFVFPFPGANQVKSDEISDALALKAQNPFRRIVFPGKNTFISIDTIRELKQEARYKLYEGKKKVFIISEADEMRPEAANALLKLLEEPPDNLMLILITSRLHRILPTIRSRCQLIYFPPLENDVILRIIKKYHTPLSENLSHIIRLALKNIKLAFDFIEDNVLDKREQSIEYLRKVVVIQKSHDLMSEIEKMTMSKDRREMRLILFFLLTWFRDAYHLKTKGREASLINLDKESNIKGFVHGYPKADYQNLINEVQKAMKDLEDPRNLNPTLIFTNLAIKLNKFIKNN